MRVGFFTCFRRDPQHYVLAEQMIRSVRQAMPGVEIVQFTDETSPEVLGVDAVRRLPNGPMLQVRLAHYAACEGEWLLLDTDIVVRRDVSDVFKNYLTCDVALTDRKWPHCGPGVDEKEMPFNTGVCFSRTPAFWAAVLAKWLSYPEDKRDWMSEQRAVAEVARDVSWRVAVLPGATYNYPPSATNETGKDAAAIWHFKGPRKEWLPKLAREASVAPSAPARAYDGPLRVFVGYDPRQPVAYHVAAHSIVTRSSKPVAMTRLQLSQLPVARRGLTEFTYSRFLVPHLCGFDGQAMFVDADVLCLYDVAELFDLARAQACDVSVVKNPRKFEWASLMVFDCAKLTRLSTEYVADPANKMFDLAWAKTIGSLPSEWNHLVGYDAPRQDAKLAHFTQGIPIWPETDQCEYAEEWILERNEMVRSVSFAELMGGSVHVKHMATTK